MEAKMLKMKLGGKADLISECLNKARDFHVLGLFEEANVLLQTVLQQDANNIPALCGLAAIARDNNLFEEAMNFLNVAMSIDRNDINVHKGLAIVYTRMGEIKPAIDQYKIALTIRYDAWILSELARLYLLAGNLDQALMFFKKAFSSKPSDPGNFHGMLQLDRSLITDEMIGDVKKILAKGDISIKDKSSFHFALGKLFDRDADYDQAFANFSAANTAKGLKYKTIDHEQFIDRIINIFSANFFDDNNTGSASESPVFIVGMPRSGTTLVEQIISSHPQVAGAGELSLIENMLAAIPKRLASNELYPECLSGNNQVLIDELAAIYEASTREFMQQGQLRVTDKMPVNFMHLGLIALLFPKAKIIHCQRHPLDVCLSCYFTNLTNKHDYAGDLKNLAHYYQQYERIMAHWKSVLPVAIHEIAYEDLVEQQESESRALINFVDLEWDDQCLSFYQTKRNVNTASVIQVRKPVYQSSVERWRRYDKYLQILKKSLGLSESALKSARLSCVTSTEINKEGEKTCSYRG